MKEDEDLPVCPTVPVRWKNVYISCSTTSITIIPSATDGVVLREGGGRGVGGRGKRRSRVEEKKGEVVIASVYNKETLSKTRLTCQMVHCS